MRGGPEIGGVRSLVVAVALGLSSCAPGDQGAPDTRAARQLSAEGWIDVTATLDPARTPVYAGDAPLKFDFLKDMRKGDILTLSAYSLGAHSGTHIDAPMHFVANGAPIDQVALDPLIGGARVIDIPHGVRLVGVDYISAEQFGAPAPRTHQILLGRGIPIVEGLDLRPVQAGDYDVIVLPLKVRGHEGAPARAIVRKRTGTERSLAP